MGKKVAAEICLYGAASCGYGWLAMGPGKLAGGKAVGKMKMFGTGTPSKSVSSCTEAYWLGMHALMEAGLERGKIVMVYMPGGERAAKVEAGSILPYFGELLWEPAPVVVVSAEEVKAAAEKPASPEMPFEKPE